MASVTGAKMARTFDKSGSIAILHRFLTQSELIELTKELSDLKYFTFSIGIKQQDYENAQTVWDLVGDRGIVLIDIAHGHSKGMGHFIEKVKKIGFKTVIAGNCCTRDAGLYLVQSGADCVRIGIGSGGVCSTKIITGTWMPVLQSIYECADIGVPIIADGGIRSSGDICKAIALGANCVCVGTMLAGTSDSPGEIFEEDGVQYKMHYGMSSKTAIDKFFDGKKTHITPEGKTEMISYIGETSHMLSDLIGGIKSSLTYSGCGNITQFQEKAVLRYS